MTDMPPHPVDAARPSLEGIEAALRSKDWVDAHTTRVLRRMIALRAEARIPIEIQGAVDYTHTVDTILVNITYTTWFAPVGASDDDDIQRFSGHSDPNSLIVYQIPMVWLTLSDTDLDDAILESIAAIKLEDEARQLRALEQLRIQREEREAAEAERIAARSRILRGELSPEGST